MVAYLGGHAAQFVEAEFAARHEAGQGEQFRFRIHMGADHVEALDDDLDSRGLSGRRRALRYDIDRRLEFLRQRRRRNLLHLAARIRLLGEGAVADGQHGDGK